MTCTFEQLSQNDVLASCSVHVSCQMIAAFMLQPQSVSAAMSSSDVSCEFDGRSATEQKCHSSDSELIDASDHELQPDSNSIEDASSNPVRLQSYAEPVRQPQPKPKARLRLRMIDEDENGVRVKVIPCPKEQFRRRLQQTNRLGEDFFVPNRAQLMSNVGVFEKTWRPNCQRETSP